MRALVRILGGAAAGLALFALLGYLGMHFDWLNRGMRLNWGGLPFEAMMPRAAWEFGAATALTVALAGWAAVRHVRSATDPGVGAVVAAALALAACVVVFGTNDVYQSVRPDPTYGTYPPFHLRVLWHGASNAGSYAVIGVLGTIALLSRRPAPAGPLHHDDPAAYRRPVQ
ncbi:hypothetical protein [Paeniglutamicibacter psychrophenolicus]|uniref:hypothetical protein n=1 Tax=Paeniglutamicibacter psychrophenolicus TaxID=257454 RepID=UPI00277DB38A|nr:hypothetical protein [Paeniglutamicibacter psychrophenolicus]MDQ0093619.1 hypothetical protein [Paeniglutamicibacter psychrophenolicus]